MSEPFDRDDATEELLGAFVLGAVDAAEQAEVEALIARDPQSSAEVERLRTALDEVIAAGAVEASPQLWDRIAAELPARPEATPGGPVTDGPVSDELAGHRSRRGTGPGGNDRRLLLALVAAAVAGVLFGVAALVVSRNEPSTELAHQIRAQADRIAGEPGASEGQLVSEDGELAVSVVLGPQGRAFVFADSLPALASDRTYQLWSLDGDEPVSLGLLGANPVAHVVAAGRGTRAMAISVEPLEGSVAPTTTPVVVGSLG